jgi:hypothetical protein
MVDGELLDDHPAGSSPFAIAPTTAMTSGLTWSNLVDSPTSRLSNRMTKNPRGRSPRLPL